MFQSHRSEKPNDEPSGYPRLLLIAFSCDPHESMEHRNGWYRAFQASQEFDVTVLCGPQSDAEALNREVAGKVRPNSLKFEVVPVDAWTRKMLNNELLFYVGYRRWLARMYEFAKELEKQHKYAASHLVSLCGYREPGDFWRLDAKFVWGPIGGTSGFPLRYLGMVDFAGGVFELVRNVVNSSQLRLSRRIRKAAAHTDILVSANRSTQRDLQKHMRLASALELETGIDIPVAEAKPVRGMDRPLRLLWAGRLRAWKGLPLIIHALAKLPKTANVQLRVVGDGVCKKGWQKLATRLQVDHMVEWIDRPPYRESLEHYRWADAFVFTSLRDTSGTGLLEALAMGAPIIGLDHQGSADIMTDDSAIRISVQKPSKTIQEFSDAIIQLANDSGLLKRLSDGARQRAVNYVWENRQGVIGNAYDSIAKQASHRDNLPIEEGRSLNANAISPLTNVVHRTPQSILES